MTIYPDKMLQNKAIAYVLSISFGALNIFAMLLPFAEDWFGRLGIIEKMGLKPCAFSTALY
ncbi:hypothetical protein H6G81_02895 [Scytonema hofmannii FACHB-248]|uniref:Uncharacterized protein n=1 Tax=Scytonema hofmannii FACHB-248 TaxID=1842502 RepID=A0ABR8GK22_9CYAN|nr:MULTISPECIES: hypothetical protein [Nostocales]MBD2603503.1 hypothetical protein [Scytonema hofmannii FACHB-248]